ncbi:OmpA family protein [Vampirovibrio sp.]|uniref:OmpA family protein n=1 Tax=Vampirovibrio sp. TaxID=2717857 RepID=UPI0035934F89
MARKHKHPEHENLERWLVSYADFMTLLFATFTALYAMAQTDAAKLKDVSTAIREGFEEKSIMNGINSVLQGKSAPSRNPDPLSQEKGAGPGVIGRFDSMTYQPGEVKSTQKLVDDLTSDLKSANHEIKSLAVGGGGSKDGPNAEAGQGKGAGAAQQAGSGGGAEAGDVPVRQVEVSVQERGIRISFDSRLLFGAGESTLQPYAYKFLDKVAARLKKFDNRRIHVEGHSDNQPIATGQFPSNWELSCARSSSVVRFFAGRHQLNPAALVAVGYGDTQPISNNATAEGRARNRRVDIIVYNEKMSAVLNPRVQFLMEQSIVKSVSDGPDQPRTVLPVLPEKRPDQPADGPVKVIIKEKDGTEKVLIPKTRAVMPKDLSLPVQEESLPAKKHT